MRENEPKYTNSLIHEDSPYLLQHAHNPVDWLPWGDDAFEKAKRENKLVLISIGYSSCHWCHVMAHESFEDEDVAAIMNEHFICIKVDREERPDVDQIYMTAVQLMTGSGGWPLNCFTLPDGRPIFGGTYYPKGEWTRILESLAESYAADQQKFEDYADNLTNGVEQTELITVAKEGIQLSADKLDEMVVNWKRTFDETEGGQNQAPKFPMPNNYQFLMQYAYHTMDSLTMIHVDRTLEKMAWGGIYDQVGGGFARYSTDRSWKVPHFEKMLYDNAQLVSLYSLAYQRTKSPLYKHVVYQTLDWVKREMTTAEGSFYAALDADSEGEEGKFYVWSKEELKEVLGKDYDFAAEYYTVNARGLWEGNYILMRQADDQNIGETHGMTEDAVRDKIYAINDKLLKKREERIRPGLDDKALTSWNALMIKGYVDAYKAFGESSFLDAALMNGKWLASRQLNKDGRLKHSYKNGKSKIDGFLEDYCFSIEAFIALYEVTFDERWLDGANLMMNYTLAHFYDEQSGMFFFTSSDEENLVTRKMEISDNVIPASNSSMAKNLWMLGILYDREDYKKMAGQMLANVYDGMEQYGPGYSNWGLVGLNMIYPYYEVAITGKDWKKESMALNATYAPNKIMMGGTKGSLPLLEGKFLDETTIFVCVNKACQLPVSVAEEALKQIRP